MIPCQGHSGIRIPIPVFVRARGKLENQEENPCIYLTSMCNLYKTQDQTVNGAERQQQAVLLCCLNNN